MQEMRGGSEESAGEAKERDREGRKGCGRPCRGGRWRARSREHDLERRTARDSVSNGEAGEKSVEKERTNRSQLRACREAIPVQLDRALLRRLDRAPQRDDEKMRDMQSYALRLGRFRSGRFRHHLRKPVLHENKLDGLEELIER